MALSNRVQNMKFMQKKGGSGGTLDNENTSGKKVIDKSEWSSATKSKTIKVLKSRKTRVKTVGYSSINQLGSINVTETQGRRTLGAEKKEDQSKEIKEDKKIIKKKREPTQELEAMEPSTRTRSLAQLWKENMKKK